MPEFTEDMTEDEFYELLEKALKVLVDMIYREYTVNVSYQDAQTSYKITLDVYKRQGQKSGLLRSM